MQPHRELSRQAATDPLADDEGQAVLRRSRLSGPAKLAYRFLRYRSRDCRGPLRCTPGEIGADQGCSEAAGRRSIEALQEGGLLRVLDKLADGTWLLQLVEPSNQTDERLVAPDPQGELFPSEASTDAPAQASMGVGGGLRASQEQETNSSPSLDGASAGACDGAFNVREWWGQMKQLVALEHRASRRCCEKAHAAGLSPADLAEIVACYATHKARWQGPGAIDHAILNWTPAAAGELLALFPTGRDPDPAERLLRQHAAEKSRIDAEAEQYRRESAAREHIFGPRLDAMSQAEQEALLAGAPDFTRTYLRRSRDAATQRHVLLQLLASRSPGNAVAAPAGEQPSGEPGRSPAAGGAVGESFASATNLPRGD